MREWRRDRLVVPMIGLVVVLAACSASEDSSAVDDQPATSAAPTTAAEAPTTTTAAVTSAAPSTTAIGDDPATEQSLVDLRPDLSLDVVVLDPTTESGSHPTLSWQPADGAASYWLTVRDADDTPYWAWTGTTTSVRVGGGDSADTNQTAALHEVMTWRVAAFDAEGALIAISDTASVSP